MEYGMARLIEAEVKADSPHNRLARSLRGFCCNEMHRSEKTTRSATGLTDRLRQEWKLCPWCGTQLDKET